MSFCFTNVPFIFRNLLHSKNSTNLNQVFFNHPFLIDTTTKRFIMGRMITTKPRATLAKEPRFRKFKLKFDKKKKNSDLTLKRSQIIGLLSKQSPKIILKAGQLRLADQTNRLQCRVKNRNRKGKSEADSSDRESDSESDSESESESESESDSDSNSGSGSDSESDKDTDSDKKRELNCDTPKGQAKAVQKLSALEVRGSKLEGLSTRVRISFILLLLFYFYYFIFIIILNI